MWAHGPSAGEEGTERSLGLSGQPVQPNRQSPEPLRGLVPKTLGRLEENSWCHLIPAWINICLAGVSNGNSETVKSPTTELELLCDFRSRRTFFMKWPEPAFGTHIFRVMFSFDEQFSWSVWSDIISSDENWPQSFLSDITITTLASPCSICLGYLFFFLLFLSEVMFILGQKAHFRGSKIRILLPNLVLESGTLDGITEIIHRQSYHWQARVCPHHSCWLYGVWGCLSTLWFNFSLVSFIFCSSSLLNVFIFLFSPKGSLQCSP